MEVKVLVIIVALIAILFLGMFGWNYIGVPQQQYLTNITGLYSLFTPYMQNEIDYRLELVDCETEKYYYDDSVVCFDCNKMDACFGYTWVDRASGRLMNSLGSSNLKFKNLDVKVGDFYYDGLASWLNCKKVGDSLECDYNLNFLSDNGNVKMIAEEESLDEIAKVICKTLVASESVSCSISEYRQIKICKCENVFVELVENKVRYGYYG